MPVVLVHARRGIVAKVKPRRCRDVPGNRQRSLADGIGLAVPRSTDDDAADGGILVTSDASAFASKGMNRLVEQIDLAKRYYNPDARITGILLTRVNPQTNVFQTIRALTTQFGELFDAPVYETFIRQTTVVMNAQMTATDLYDMPKINAAANDYKKFTNEFLVREGYEPIPAEVLGIRE